MHIDEQVGLDRRAVAETVRILESWTPADAGRPTPCAGWTITDLLAHCTVQQRGFAAAARGERTTVADWHPAAEAEPAAAYRAACAEVDAAFAALADPDAPMLLPEFGEQPFPARLAVGFHLVDNVVHAWDLARALGVAVELDDETVRAALDVARAVPDDERRGQPGSPFARALAVPPGTGALDETLLLLGRDPGWAA